MADKGLTIRELCERVGSTYEYIRKLVRGLSLPSKYMLNSLSPILDLGVDRALHLIAADKIMKQHGTIPIELAGNTQS